MSIGKLYVNGEFQGTAWLIHPAFVVTAAHCVGDMGTKAQVSFLDSVTNVCGPQVEAEVVELNDQYDGALLRLVAPHTGLTPLEVSRTSGDARPGWRARGFSAITHAALAGALELEGAVGTSTTLQLPGNPTVIQLNCTYGWSTPTQRLVGRTGKTIHVMAGYSGSPVIAGPNGRVIGIIRCSFDIMPPDQIFASRVEDMFPSFQRHITPTAIREWERQSASIRPHPTAAGNS
jgi:hypothetical protein